MDTHKINGMCACIKGYPQLKDVVIQIMFKTMWRKLGKIIKRLKRLIELKPNAHPRAKT
jgi:hypothetical protein